MVPFRLLLVGLTVLAASGGAAGETMVIQERPRQPGVQPVAPPRDVTAQEGSGILRGRLTGGEAGLPLRRAVVRLHGATLREGRMTMSDEQGRSEIRDLPPGRYHMVASKPGYISLQYGQRRPFGEGRPVELRNGGVLDDLNFHLPRGAVIAGQIVDEFGEPVAEAVVTPMRYRYLEGRRRLMPAGRFSRTTARATRTSSSNCVRWRRR